MAKVLPVHLVNQVTSELRLAAKRMLTARSVRRKLVSQKGGRINVGCGKNPIQGWINLDVVSQKDVWFWDCRSGLPFSDGAVAAIYAEHFFEHLDLESEARRFLRECLRCLQPGGVLRLVVPDAGAYVRAYSGPWEPLADMRPARSHCRWMARRMAGSGLPNQNAIDKHRFPAGIRAQVCLRRRNPGYDHAPSRLR